jgi:hypothetical protein
VYAQLLEARGARAVCARSPAIPESQQLGPHCAGNSHLHPASPWQNYHCVHVAAMLLSCPGVEISIYSTCKRISQKILRNVQKFALMMAGHCHGNAWGAVAGGRLRGRSPDGAHCSRCAGLQQCKSFVEMCIVTCLSASPVSMYVCGRRATTWGCPRCSCDVVHLLL